MTLPTLFNDWGALAPVAGAMRFGLLVFAGITSSLAMGQPVLIKAAGRWGDAVASFGSGAGWPLAPDSVLGRVLHVGADSRWVDAQGFLTPVFVQDVTHLLLAPVFAACAALVWLAWSRKEARP